MALRRTLVCLSEKKLGTAAAYYDRPGRFSDIIRKVIPASTWEVGARATYTHTTPPPAPPRTQPYRTGTRHARAPSPAAAARRPRRRPSLRRASPLRRPPPDPSLAPPRRSNPPCPRTARYPLWLLGLPSFSSRCALATRPTTAANEGCGALQAERHARPAPDVAGQHDDREGAAYQGTCAARPPPRLHYKATKHGPAPTRPTTTTLQPSPRLTPPPSPHPTLAPPPGLPLPGAGLAGVGEGTGHGGRGPAVRY